MRWALPALGLWGCSGELEDAPNLILPGGAGQAGSPQAGGNGSSGSGGSAGGTATAGSGGTDPGPSSGLPCDVDAFLRARCQGCHARPPVAAPIALVTHADLVAPARNDASLRVVDFALARMQRGEMPPPPAPAVTPAELAVISDWVAAGAPEEACGTLPPPADGGMSGTDPFDTETVCSSGDYWTEDDEESEKMRPGDACIACHSRDEGPELSIAGTVYPTAHEPINCDGADDSEILVVITDADGQVLELEVNSAGNFHSAADIAFPFNAKVVFEGRERHMGAAQMTGDCNGCHTAQGANGAPGRILLP